MKLRRSKHEWGLWSRPQERYAANSVQTRTCQRCGKIQTKRIPGSFNTLNGGLQAEIPDAALDELKNVR
jgi:hypothetical protein